MLLLQYCFFRVVRQVRHSRFTQVYDPRLLSLLPSAIKSYKTRVNIIIRPSFITPKKHKK